MLDIGQNISASNINWKLPGDVSKISIKYIRNLVPIYAEWQKLITEFNELFVRENQKLYDLGLSTDSLTKLLADIHKSHDCQKIVTEIEEKNERISN